MSDQENMVDTAAETAAVETPSAEVAAVEAEVVGLEIEASPVAAEVAPIEAVADSEVAAESAVAADADAIAESEVAADAEVLASAEVTADAEATAESEVAADAEVLEFGELEAEPITDTVVVEAVEPAEDTSEAPADEAAADEAATSEGEPTQFELPSHADIRMAAQIHEQCEAALEASGDVRIDCSAVERVDAAVLQCIGSLVGSLQQGARSLELVDRSEPFDRAVAVLGFEELLRGQLSGTQA